MTINNQRLTFWCLPHREVCYATHAKPEVQCEQGNHVLSENFQHDKWHFCCGCQTFFARADNEAARKDCPACGNLATQRYLCHNCQVFSFEAGSRLTQRLFAFAPTGAPPRACPGCASAPPPQIYEHKQCLSFHADFQTARTSCPFCGDQLGAPPANYDFSGWERRPSAEYLQNVRGLRAEPAASGSGVLAVAAQGRFLLTPFQDEQTCLVFPAATQFTEARDYQTWQEAFDCAQPSAGELWLGAPAVARFDAAAGEYRITQKGKLEVQVKTTAPLTEPPWETAPWEPLPEPLPEPRIETPRPTRNRPPRPTSPEQAVTPTSRPPLPVLIGAGAGGLLLVGALLYFAFSSTKRTIIAKVKQGQIVTPYGDSAYDLFLKGGLSESDLNDLRKEVAPLLASRGNEVVRQLVNDGYNPPVNELNDAAKLYSWLNQLAPGNAHKAREHYFQGRAAYEGKDWNGAENEFRQAMKLEPAWALPVNTLARVFMRRRDYETARTCYENAIQLDQNWIFPRINLCVLANEQLKNYSLGEQACRDVLQLDPNKASAYYYLGRALEGQGSRCGAYEQYRLAAEKAAGATSPGFNVNNLNTIVGRLARQCGGH